MTVMIRHLHRHRFRWYILATLIIVTYPVVVSLTLLSSSLGSLLVGTEDLNVAKSLLITNPAESQRLFTQAANTLEQGSTILQQAPWYTKLITPLPPFRWQVQLIKASHALAESGAITSRLSRDYPTLTKASDPSTILAQSSDQFFRWYDKHTLDLDALQLYLSSAETELNAVPNWVIPGHARELYTLKNQVHEINLTVPKTRKLITEIGSAFGSGDSNPHTFLALFQNDGELRASGGFFGSYATLTASGGRIRSYTFGKNIYKLDTPFTSTKKYPAPDQLATITSAWAFRDSNIGSPGFLNDYSPTIKRFYEEESGQAIDGIFYVNVSMLEALLKVSGPITLPSTSTEVTSETISTALTQFVEKDYFQQEANKQVNEPKSILNDLIPLIFEKLQTQSDVLSKLAPALASEIQAKSLQVWSTKQSVNEALSAFMPSDAPLPGNWMKVVNSNIGGLKSSRSITQNVEITTQTNFLRHTITYNVTITRTHEGNGSWPDGENKNYMEIYLPPAAHVRVMPENHGGESSLTPEDRPAVGTTDKKWETHADETSSWKRISLWATTGVGEKTTYTFSYELPAETAFTDAFSYIKQAGSSHETLHINGISYPVTSNLSVRL
jgi:hypothetical protein